ncbi:hypothetical protein FRC03_002025 [Tulasnella sp. 419]|nr:hypothetical protein FRC03_002025 [Tulasnella sp. 419]
MPPRFPSSISINNVSSSSCRRTATSRLNYVSRSGGPGRTYSTRATAHLKPRLSTSSVGTSGSECWSEARNQVGAKRFFHASRPLLSTASDPYKVLGVPRNAAAGDIKKAYFALAKKYHPDTSKEKDAKEKFVEIQAAYDILSDKDKRAAYDRYGSASQQPGFDPDAFSSARGPFGGGGFGGFQDFGGPFGAAGGRSQADLFEALFGGAFGGGPRAGRAPGFESMNPRGDDIEVTVNVSFIESAKGTKRTVNVAPVVNCKPCTGSGLKPGAKRTTCGTCGGTGTRTFVVDSGFQMAATCPTCRGSGTLIPNGSQCGECAGIGKVKSRKAVEVEVPAGVEQGMTIRVPYQGNVPLEGKGKEGDLLVRVNVQPSKTFRRQGNNIYYEGKIPFHTAVLGDRVRVPTLDGEVEVRIPGGTQPGQEFVLKGRGVSTVYGREKGDQYVSFSVTIPRSLTPIQRELLQQYADDVEGKTGNTSDQKPSSTTNNASEGVSRERDEPPQGTASFSTKSSSSSSDFSSRSRSGPPPEHVDDDGWLGWARNKLRNLF